MTICLTLVCEEGKSLVAVADRMVSVEFLSLEFEQSNRKIDLLARNFAALTAGDALAHTDLIRQANEEISGMSQPSVIAAASAVEECFIQTQTKTCRKISSAAGWGWTTPRFLSNRATCPPNSSPAW